MGDGTFYYYDCPSCKSKDGVEVYDAPSSVLYSEFCVSCGWEPNEPFDYYEIGENKIVLCTRKDYIRLYKNNSWVKKRRQEITDFLRKQRKELNA